VALRETTFEHRREDGAVTGGTVEQFFGLVVGGDEASCGQSRRDVLESDHRSSQIGRTSSRRASGSIQGAVRLCISLKIECDGHRTHPDAPAALLW